MTKAKFKIPAGGQEGPPDPESLFQDLKNRAPEIQALWSHQADLLREYAKSHKDTQDVALELPTGTGKTLVGLLIAEYRRRTHGNRVAYLCPTRQLANQVEEQSAKYGIRAAAVLRPDYDGLNDYRRSKLVAITTYSSLFNVNPRFDDAQTIVMDDAHAAEGFISSMWAVEISRHRNKELYEQLVATIADAMEDSFVEMLRDDNCDPYRRTVDLLPLPDQHRLSAAISDLLDARLEEKSPEKYAWSTIQERLHACGVYLSWGTILIRPLIPPTLEHEPFAQASQRVYMSATLGEGGELERITGVRQIERLAAPAGWEKHTAGRRLFLLPGLSMDHDDARQVALSAVQLAGRALVLAPRGDVAASLREDLQTAGVPVLGPEDIEGSMDAFTQQDNAALVLANRYDGIDLPGDKCRLLILVGQCAGTHIMERFLLSRLRATNLLRDRIRTRFTQGVGRCCRGTTDYAAVFLLEQDLIDFCLRSENCDTLHPELQAELEFGFENSEKQAPDAFIELLKMFLSRDRAWDDAEQAITSSRSKKTKRKDPLSETLRSVVAREVDYVYALWRKDFPSALTAAHAVSDNLNGDEFEGYRAWWYYHGAVAAWLHHNENEVGDAADIARDLFARAARCSKSVSWFGRLAGQGTPAPNEDVDPLTTAAIERILDRLERLGLHGRKFEEAMKTLEERIGSDDATPFELGLEQLGQLLGFDATRPNVDGAPDGVWALGDKHALILEAKSDQGADGPVSLTDVRQARTHEGWARTNVRLASDAEVVTVIITPRRTLDEQARASADDLRHCDIDELRGLAGRAIACLRRARAELASADGAKAIQTLIVQLDAEQLMPGGVRALLTKTPLRELPGFKT